MLLQKMVFLLLMQTVTKHRLHPAAGEYKYCSSLLTGSDGKLWFSSNNTLSVLILIQKIQLF